MYIAGGSECTAYDVIVSSKFLETVQVSLHVLIYMVLNVNTSNFQHLYIHQLQTRPKLKTFFLTIVLEGLEDKYQVLFSRGKQHILHFLHPCMDSSVVTWSRLQGYEES